MRVVPIPCLNDNYAYLLVCEATGNAAIVDVPECAPVWKCIQEENVEMVAILNTHHHWDHVDGNPDLLKKLPHLAVYGHHSDEGRIPGQTVFLKDTDTITIGNLKGTLSHNPGHTTGGITYYFEDVAFTGDTLFGAGCGRLYEGTPTQMYRSLNENILKHSSAKKFYFGHEYTEKNLQFALTVEPGNPKITERLNRVKSQRRAGDFTTPATVEDELATNPFLRCDSPEIIERVRQIDPSSDLKPTSVFKIIRQLKDKY